ncbi:class I SAM-dependent methyltransferase, partial [uncultured Bilophila sp.]
VKVTGVTISTEQLAYAREHDAGHLVNWLLQDYRSMEGQFDRIVSVGMFEHVGRKNYDIFMKTTKRLLKPSGLFLLHTIGNSKKKTGTDPWINKYIFPNGMLPSPVCVAKAITGLYVMEDWHNFGADYDKTLMAWHQRFEEGYAEGAFQCSERVRRMYRYYLLSCAGAFRARDIQLWQIVLSPEGVEGGYCCQR